MKDKFTEKVINYRNNKGQYPEHVTMSSETFSKLTGHAIGTFPLRGNRLSRIKIIINEWINKNQFIFY